jgi:peroxiredoxin/Tfp pilus assembly protein PilF
MQKSLWLVIALALAAAALAGDAAPAAKVDPATASRDDVLAAMDAALTAGDAATADTLLEAAVTRFPDDEEVAGVALQYYYRDGKLDKALGVAARMAGTSDRKVDWLYVKMECERELGRTADALRTLDDIVALDARAEAYVVKGDIYLKQATPDYAAAAAAYEAALGKVTPEAKPSYATVIYNLGCCYARQGQKEKALAQLTEAIGIQPLLGDGLRTDADLASLVGDPAFEKLAADAAAKAAAAALENMTVKPGQAAPGFKLPDLTGKTYTLADFKGTYLVLNIWATWCPPCQAEIPDLIAFAQAHPEAAVVGVSVDEPNANLAAFMSDYGITYLVLRDDGTVGPAYLGEHGGIPQTYFIDREGIVRGHIYGSTDRENFERRLAALAAPPK